MASSAAVSGGIEAKNLSKGKLVLLGRFLFALIFLLGGPSHFSKQTIAYATSQGVPLASIVVPLSGMRRVDWRCAVHFAVWSRPVQR
jgi:uncharacterized membrane protein YphA (DoxX/SURF4 family)